MSPGLPSRLFRAAFLASWLAFFAFAFFPIANRLTRLGLVVAVVALVVCHAVLAWPQRRWRYLMPGLGCAAAIFLLWPARPLPAAEDLRRSYAECLRRYEGVRYVWGGENRLGMDCSGLVRRGLVDALLIGGLRTGHPELTRRGLSLWWHDGSAEELGRAPAGLTQPVLEAPSLNALDPARLLPGDMAVTRSGIHVLAYLGQGKWIEADPVEHRVITVAVPVNGNAWFETPMRIVRWRVLAE